jgi:hypothetical protein
MGELSQGKMGSVTWAAPQTAYLPVGKTLPAKLSGATGENASPRVRASQHFHEESHNLLRFAGAKGTAPGCTAVSYTRPHGRVLKT